MKLAYTIPETMDALGIRRTKLYELINSRQLETMTVGRRRLVKAASLTRFVEAA